MNRISLLLIVLTALSLAIPLISALDITTCGNLNTPNTVYDLKINITNESTCFTIANNFITLDCGGNMINYSQSSLGHAVIDSGFNSTTIKNCNIVQGDAAISGSNALSFDSASSVTLNGNNITTNGNNSQGISLGGTGSPITNSLITNNSVTVNSANTIGINLGLTANSTLMNNTVRQLGSGLPSTPQPGIFLYLCQNVTAAYNNISTAGDSNQGIWLHTSLGNTISYNNITTTGTSVGIDLAFGSNNTIIIGNNITTNNSNANGITVGSSSNNTVTNNTIQTNGTSAYGVSLSLSNGSIIRNNTLTTYGSNSQGISLGQDCNYNNITRNNITTSADNANGIQTESAIYNNVTSNTVITNGTSSQGIRIWSGSNHTLVRDNHVETFGTAYAIAATAVSGSNNNSFINNTLITHGNGSQAFAIDSNSSDNNASQNNITTSGGNNAFGMQINSYSFRNTLSSNTVVIVNLSSNGIFVNNNSDSSTISGNNITTSSYGIYLSTSSYSNISGNSLNSSNATAIYISPSSTAAYYNHSIDTTNTKFGKPIYYYFGNSSITISNLYDIGQLYVANSTNLTISNITMINNDGITLVMTTESTIANSSINTSATNDYGIYLYASSGNNLTNNSITTTSTSAYGLYLNVNSSNNTLTGNTVNTTGNSSHNIYLSSNSNKNTLTGNNVTAYGANVNVIRIESSFSNNVSLSRAACFGNVTPLGIGILVSAGNALNNRFFDNIVTVNCTPASALRVRDTANNNYYIRNNVTLNNATGSGIRVGTNAVSHNNTFDSNIIIINTASDQGVQLTNSSRNNILLNNILNITVPSAIYISTDGTSSKNNMTNTTFAAANGSVRYPQTINISVSTEVTSQKLNISYSSASNTTAIFLNTSDAAINTLLNKSAHLIFTGLSFLNASPSVDLADSGTFASCPTPTRCDNVTYSFATGVLEFDVVSFTTYASEEVRLQCGDLNQSNTVYNMSRNLNSNGTCFNIKANNVTLDCNGFTINYSKTQTGYGVNITNYNHTTIRNCSIAQINATFEDAHAVYLESSSDNTITNNNITVNGDKSSGIMLNSSSNGTFASGNSILATGSEGMGVGLFSSGFNNFTSNTFTSSSGPGIIIASSSDNNTFLGNSIVSTSVSRAPHGVMLMSSNDNVFTSNNISSATGSGVLFDSSQDNLIYNNLINGTSSVSVDSSPNLWNISKTPGTNIMGGGWLGGNFYANSAGNAFSQTCTDAGGDGLCDSSYTLNTSNIDYLPLVPDTTPPVITAFTLSSTSVNVGDTITYSCTATDNSGSASTSVTGIDTSSAGSKTATCTATDTAGNNATSTISYTVTAAASSVTSGFRSCSPNWNCTEWSECSGGSQTRRCVDLNFCSSLDRPEESRECGGVCTPNWGCSAYSECTQEETQSRTCSDTKNCGTTAGMPGLARTCVYIPAPLVPQPEDEKQVIENAQEYINSAFEAIDSGNFDSAFQLLSDAVKKTEELITTSPTEKNAAAAEILLDSVAEGASKLIENEEYGKAAAVLSEIADTAGEVAAADSKSGSSIASTVLKRANVLREKDKFDELADVLTSLSLTIKKMSASTLALTDELEMKGINPGLALGFDELGVSFSSIAAMDQRIDEAGILLSEAKSIDVAGTKRELITLSYDILNESLTKLPEATKVAAETTTVQTTADAIDLILSHATTDAAKSMLQKMKTYVAAGGGVSVQKELTSYRITNTEVTDKEVNRSIVKLLTVASRQMRTYTIIEYVPKTVAASADEMLFTGTTPTIFTVLNYTVLEDDPIIDWSSGVVTIGERTEVTYILKVRLDTLNSITVAAGEPSVVPVIKTPAYVEPIYPARTEYIRIVIAVLIGGAILLILYRKFHAPKKPIEIPKESQKPELPKFTEMAPLGVSTSLKEQANTIAPKEPAKMTAQPDVLDIFEESKSKKEPKQEQKKEPTKELKKEPKNGSKK